MNRCLQASGICVGVLSVLAAAVGAVVNLVYLSIALDREPSDDPNCPNKIRDWCIGILVWCIWSIVGPMASSKMKSRDDDLNEGEAGGNCIQALIGLCSLGFGIAMPIVIDQDLRGVCPDSAYDKAYNIIFVYYVTLLSVMAVAGCVGCIGFAVMANRGKMPNTVCVGDLASKV